jgi:diguanylate cyclase (GGDEF)-like protein
VARLRHAAYHDRLTGLPTRARLGQHLEAAIEESSAGDGVVALVQLDLDRFKEVNDSLGHTWVTSCWSWSDSGSGRSSPAGAMVARVGADEFAVAARVPGQARRPSWRPTCARRSPPPTRWPG